MTKKEARARREDWARAVKEGRVLRLFGGQTLRSYPTRSAADAALKEAEVAGLAVERISENH